jgi:hypothetical protein
MATLLKIGPAERAGLDKLLAYAKANPTTEPQLRAILVGDRPSADQYPEHQFVWPIGFRCTFNYEHQPNIGLCRHLSVSAYDKSDPEPQIPAPHVMNAIAAEFGYVEGRLDYMWIDEKTKSINMVQQVAKCGMCNGVGDLPNVAYGDDDHCKTCGGSGYKW